MDALCGKSIYLNAFGITENCHALRHSERDLKSLSPSELRDTDSVSVPHCQTGDLNLSGMSGHIRPSSSARGSLYYRQEQFSETVTNQCYASCCKEVHTVLSNFTLAKSVNTETHGTASALVKAKAVPLHATKALWGKEAPTHSQPRH
jgi:hypothetical protein